MRDFADVRMGEGVVADLVAFAIDALHGADVLLGLLADHEEGALDVVLLEDVEDLRESTRGRGRRRRRARPAWGGSRTA